MECEYECLCPSFLTTGEELPGEGGDPLTTLESPTSSNINIDISGGGAGNKLEDVLARLCLCSCLFCGEGGGWMDNEDVGCDCVCCGEGGLNCVDRDGEGVRPKVKSKDVLADTV